MFVNLDIDYTGLELKYKDVTQKIIGASFEVHKVLGRGFREVIYHRALTYEFQAAGLIFDKEKLCSIYYKDLAGPIGSQVADFIVEEKVLVEIKAVAEIDDGHIAQTLNYLKVFKLEVGLLVNFGENSLKFKRLVL
ncbi:GxxExxY protein [Chitinophaga caeni]|uniref:GxxExxY protein n=1 Tax=Chitinophaga caeni TaxID=2029983 RepID=A0A291QT81_9BACT|nr:GxxExxY protein [Chitinophaga caeni]ATL47137.1 GxxExxY protein [Chitinophaga caeni]